MAIVIRYSEGSGCLLPCLLLAYKVVVHSQWLRAIPGMSRTRCLVAKRERERTSLPRCLYSFLEAGLQEREKERERESREQRAESGERRAESGERRAESGERRAESREIKSRQSVRDTCLTLRGRGDTPVTLLGHSGARDIPRDTPSNSPIFGDTLGDTPRTLLAPRMALVAGQGGLADTLSLSLFFFLSLKTEEKIFGRSPNSICCQRID